MNLLARRLVEAGWLSVLGVTLVVELALGPWRPAAAEGLAAALPKANPARAGFDAAKLAEMRPRFLQFIEDQKIAGAVAVVARRGHVGSALVVGLRDRDKRIPMTGDTVFRIASMTKIVTAVAVMMLEQEGKLHLEDPLEEHLPEFRGLKLNTSAIEGTLTLVEPARRVTIRDLLTHTSGLRCQMPPSFADLETRTLATVAAALSQHPLEAQPGARWKYCGPPFDVLGRLVEVASGQPFATFLAKRIFGPLGMRDTAFELDRRQRRRLAVAYEKGPEGGLVPMAPRPTTRPLLYPTPSGGLFSSAADMLKLGQMLLSQGRAANGRRVLAPATVEKLTQVHFTSTEKVGFTPGLGMGLGVQVVRTPTEVSAMLSPGTFGHGGAHGTQLWMDPRREMIFLLMIQRRGFGNGDASEIRQALQEIAVSALRRDAQDLRSAAPPSSSAP